MLMAVRERSHQLLAALRPNSNDASVFLCTSSMSAGRPWRQMRPSRRGAPAASASAVCARKMSIARQRLSFSSGGFRKHEAHRRDK